MLKPKNVIMKKASILPISVLVLMVSSLFMTGCKVGNRNNDYLKKVLNNLDRISSASYCITREAWAPGDTSASGIYNKYIKEFDHPEDTTIGASFVSLMQEDTTQMTFCYDGKMRAIVYPDDQSIVIDSFKNVQLPFRALDAPFFNYTKSIIRYALETNDSISVKYNDFKDSLYVSLTIFNDFQVEFFGKAYYLKNPFLIGPQTSKYEIWISKTTNLPYRVRREMSHNISVATCRNVKLNQLKIEDFIAADYFQPNYTVESYGQKRKSIPINDLVGKVAPDWALKDANGNTLTLKDLKSKVLLIQFTSVNCGYCILSIRFLKQLASEYKIKDFDFVAIESWTQNPNVLKSYQNRNSFNYKFLMSTKDITNNYHIKGVPVFFILDKHRVIRKVITGYGVDTTDKEIRDVISELIQVKED